MRNKSRKRILHEQRVEIAQLRRKLADYVAARELIKIAQTYEPQKIELIHKIPPYNTAPAQAIEDAKKRADFEATKLINEALARGEIIERIETERQECTEVRYRLTVMKRRR